MEPIYRRGDDLLLLSHTDENGEMFGVVRLSDGREFPARSVAQILARGYWEPVAVALKFVNGEFIAKYDEDQPRDEAGRFSSDGGGGNAEPVSDVQAAVSLRMYTAYGHDIINNSLRGTRDDEAVREETQRSIAGLDSLISNSPTLTEDTTLYRGIAGAIAEDFRSLQPGDTFTDKGYTSTTSEKYVADKFGSDAGSYGEVPYVNLIIDAPAGSKAFDVDTYVNERYISGTGRYENGLTPRGEAEFILPRDATFEVTRNDGNDLYVRLVNG